MASAEDAVLPPDENRGPEILAICGSLVALSVIIVTLRIWVRARIVRQVGIDDWTIIGATVRSRFLPGRIPSVCGSHKLAEADYCLYTRSPSLSR